MMQRLGILTHVWNIVRGNQKSNAAPDVRRTAYTARTFAAVAGQDWQHNAAHYYDVELLPYPFTRIVPRVAFAAKRAAETSRIVPKSLLAMAWCSACRVRLD